jgi:bacterioferritin
MSETKMDQAAVVNILNKILEIELAGVVRYTHYSLMIFGHNRIPIVSWLRDQANEALTHAQEAGEMITLLGEHPSLAIGPLLETHKHNVRDILMESLEAERGGVEYYKQLLDLTRDKSVLLEEYARRMIYQEVMHCGEVDKMLRSPGEIKPFSG